MHLRQGERWLATGAAEVDPEGVALVDGVFDYGEPGLRMRGTGATVDLASGEAHAREVDWVLTRLSLRGEAAEVHRESDRLQLAGAALTRCAPGSKLWQLRAAEVSLEPAKSVVKARHVRLHLGGVPVFYVPYARFRFDAERASGFLSPQIRYEEDSGLDIALPYYLNLAPNYDATLAARHLRARGTGVEAEFRHLHRRARSNLQAAFLPRDRAYRADRWLWRLQHRGRRGGWATDVDFTAVSDDDYFTHMDTSLALASQVVLPQRASLRYERGGWQARLSAAGAQRLEPGISPYRRLPEAALFHDGSAALFDWTFGASWTAFRTGRSGAQGAGQPAGIEGSRLHVEPRLRLPLARDWGFLTLAVGSRHTRYALEGDGGADPESKRDIRLASVDGGLRFERDLRGGRWLQTLEPRLRYFHQSHARQDHLPLFDAAPLSSSYDQLFHDNRFAGVDRIGDAKEVAVGVASRLMDGRGREALTARFGAVARLRQARIRLPNEPAAPKSVVAADLGTEFGNMRVRATFAWDDERTGGSESGFALAYRRDETRLVNLGYRRRPRADVEQTDVSFHWALNPRWRLFGRWNHDWRFGQMVDGIAGFHYAGCCGEVKLLAHKTILASATGVAGAPRADRGVIVEIVLRGLGGVGGGVDARLARAIRGFRPSATP